MGGLDHLARLMLSNNVEVQSNACGCVTNLAILDENKVRIANSAVLPRLIKLAGSNDLRVQRNAAGALLNLTHTGTAPRAFAGRARSTRLMLVFHQCNATLSVPLRCAERNRPILVQHGALMVIARLLTSQIDTEVQYYCAAAASNLAVDGMSPTSA